MRHTSGLCLLLLVLFGLGSSAWHARAARPVASHVVVARLVSWPREQHTPHCGVKHSVALMEYELVRTEQGEPIGPRFWIAVSCPEMARGRGPTAVQRIVVGDVHRLELTQTYPSDVPRPRPQPGVTSYFWPLRTDVATP